MPDSAVDKRYREFVWLSYLVLPGERSRTARLALARRIAGRNLPRRRRDGGAWARARERVARQSLRPPLWLRLSVVPRPRGRRAGDPDNATLAALAPEERLAYVLCRITRLRRHVARELLAGLGVAGPDELLDRIEAMADLDIVVPALAPGPGRPRRSRLPVAAACAVTCALLAVPAVRGRETPVEAARTGAASPPVPAAPAETAYWRGALPGGGGSGTLLCRHTTLTDGSTRHQGLLVWRGGSHPARDCSDGMTGLWWRSPAGRWFYLAAAAPRVELTVRGGERRGALRVVRGDTGERAPRAPVMRRAG